MKPLLLIAVVAVVCAGCIADSKDDNSPAGDNKLYPESDTTCFLRVAGNQDLTIYYNRSYAVSDSNSKYIAFQFYDDNTESSFVGVIYGTSPGTYKAGKNITDNFKMRLSHIQIFDTYYIAETNDAYMALTIDSTINNILRGSLNGELYAVAGDRRIKIHVTGSFSAPYPDKIL